MARPYRLQAENCLYHITSRGNNRKKIYINKYDYEKFIEYLLKSKERFKFFVYAYCLMPNHYHLLLETIQPNLSKIMQYLNTSYAAHYNKKRNKSGHLFQGRYKSIVVDKDNYFLELTRYIHLNPMRAKIVLEPEGYKWTSFRGYMHKNGDGVIDRKEIERYYKIIPYRYKNFVLEGINKKVNIFNKVYAGFILGKSEFIRSTLKDLKNQIEGDAISYSKAITNNIDMKDILAKVSRAYKISVKEICKSKNKPLLAKKIGVYLSKRLTNLTNKEIGSFFNVSYSAVSKAAMALEKIIDKNKKIKRDVERIISHFKA